MRTALVLFVVMLAAGNAPAEGEKMREVKVGDTTVRLDLSTQVLRITVPEDRDYGESRGAVEAPILPALSGARGSAFVSAAVLAARAKAFDDGLYAAAELEADRWKGPLLDALAEALAPVASEPAAAVVLAGAALGRGREPAGPAAALAGEFLADELRSKPIGFYTWSEDLSRIFRQDRMLQSELKGKAGIEAIVRALAGDEDRAEAYRRALVLAERLTNPLAKEDLRPLVAAAKTGTLEVPAEEVFFFPPSRAPETELVKKLHGDRPIPDGFDLASEMLARLRDGRLSLAPGEHDGWYAHVLFSLEPLAVPERTAEAARLSLDGEYRKMLAELFKGLLTLTRETHVKQLEIPAAGAAPPPRVLPVSPGLRAEPLATHYFRRAQAYAFVRGVLVDVLGGKGAVGIYRRTPGGPVKERLYNELLEMERLFLGASEAVMEDLGLDPLSTGGAERNVRGAFEAFRSGYADDPDAGGDQRCMVPVFFDVERKMTKVWVFLGWAERPIVVSYEKEPRVVAVLDAWGRPANDHPPVQFEKQYARVLYPVTAEVYVKRILDRREFRAHCDRFRTRKAILSNLE